MNKKQLSKILEEARQWTNAEYEAKGGQPGTDRYFMAQQLARLTLLMHIQETYIEKKEDA
jgi:hypothetical protein